MAKKVLLADDSITIQKVISITFASEDYDLIIVGDGDSAIAKIKEVQPDVILADIAMPGKNGYEVCEAVKKDPAFQRTPVLLLSGTFEPLDEKEAQRVKADDHIVKPFESQELIEKVKNLLSKPPAPVIEVERPTAPEVKAPMPADIWEVGDFIGTEEVKEPVKTEEKDIWGTEFFEEPAKKVPKKPEQKPRIEEDFIELELKEEELQPAEEARPAPPKPKESFVAAPEIKAPAPMPPVISEISPPQPPKVAPPPLERVEAKVREVVKEEIGGVGAIPAEKIEETIRKIARDVIEEIAWEVIPDLAEELIKEEIRKTKEAIGKVK
jgi:CheY-like chemotaxis protein